MNKPSKERIERAALAIWEKHRGGLESVWNNLNAWHLQKEECLQQAEVALATDDSHLAARLERVMKLLGEAELLLLSAKDGTHDGWLPTAGRLAREIRAELMEGV